MIAIIILKPLFLYVSSADLFGGTTSIAMKTSQKYDPPGKTQKRKTMHQTLSMLNWPYIDILWSNFLIKTLRQQRLKEIRYCWSQPKPRLRFTTLVTYRNESMLSAFQKTRIALELQLQQLVQKLLRSPGTNRVIICFPKPNLLLHYRLDFSHPWCYTLTEQPDVM